MGVVLDLAHPTKVLCVDHAETVRDLRKVPTVLQQRWWPKRGMTYHSRRAVTGRDWIHPADMRS